jgi:hypothetical protein
MLGACIGQVHLQQQPGNYQDKKLDIVGVQEVRWDKGVTVRVGDYNFFYRKGNKYHELRTGLFVHHRIVSAVKRE